MSKCVYCEREDAPRKTLISVWSHDKAAYEPKLVWCCAVEESDTCRQVQIKKERAKRPDPYNLLRLANQEARKTDVNFERRFL